MFPFIKLLKIVLPVTTVTAATIATVSLVSFQKADNKLDKEAEDKVLEDFEKQAEDFKEQVMLYSEDGQGDGVTVNEEMRQKLLDKSLEKNLDKGKDLSKEKAPPQDLNDSQKALQLKDNERQKSLEPVDPSNSKDGEDPDDILPQAEPELQDLSNAIDPSEAADSPESKKDIPLEASDSEGEQATDVGVEGSEPSLSAQVETNEDIAKPKEGLDQKSKGDEEQTSNVPESLDKDESSEISFSKTDNDPQEAEDILNSEKTTQSPGVDSPDIGSHGSKDGIKGEHGADEMTKDQIDRMVKLEQDTLSALTDLQKLVE